MARKKRPDPPAPVQPVDSEAQLELALKAISKNLQGKPEWQFFLSQVEVVGKQFGFHVTANLSFEIESNF